MESQVEAARKSTAPVMEIMKLEPDNLEAGASASQSMARVEAADQAALLSAQIPEAVLFD